MREEFHETVRVAGDRERVWALVTDVPEVLSWISIVEETRLLDGDDRYEAVLRDRLGFVSLRADLRIAVRERQPGARLRADAEGEDRQVGSRLAVDVVLSLGESPEGTLVDVRGSYEVTGRAAALGSGQIRRKAAKVLAEFAAGTERALDAAIATGPA